MHDASGKTSLLHEFAAAACGRISPDSTSPAGNSQVKLSSVGRYCRTMGMWLSGNAATMAM
jgi:hypothetical protein